MNIKDIVTHRHTTHHFKIDPIDDAIINEALSLVVHAPNHHLTYPYHFYNVKGGTRESLLAYAFNSFSQKSIETAEQKLKKWSSIPGWLLVTQKNNNDEKTTKEDFASISIAMYILMLALDEKDIGAKWSTASLFETDGWFDLCKINKNKETIVGMLWYGYKDKEPKVFKRPSIQQYSSILE